jgi:release factor glutamine methyltransferase
VTASGRPVPPTPLRRWFWRRLRRAWFLVAQRRRHDRLVVEDVLGSPILVLPQVFNPRLLRTGEILAEVVADHTPPGGRVLDLGAGSGVIGVVAARLAASVIAVDVNPAAVRCARINALLNGVEDRVEVREGDLFDTVRGERFDLVAFNPPYLPGEPRDALQRAFRSGDVLERFSAGLGDHLAAGGRALVVLSTDGRGDEVLDMLLAQGHTTTAVTSRNLRSEVVTVWQISRVSPR